MTRRTTGPYWIRANYGGRCANPSCGRGVKKGEDVLYFPATRRVLCCWEPCGPKAYDEMKQRSANEEVQPWPQPSSL